MFLSKKSEEYDKKLCIGLSKGKYHRPIVKHNTSKLKLFIEVNLNPILRALCGYNALCNS
jgi:hypothetical protein